VVDGLDDEHIELELVAGESLELVAGEAVGQSNLSFQLAIGGIYVDHL
jgi:hypothetical protein